MNALNGLSSSKTRSTGQRILLGCVKGVGLLLFSTLLPPPNGIPLFTPLAALWAGDLITFKPEPMAPQKALFGQVRVEAADGGLLLEEPSGQYWMVEPEMLVARDSDPKEFKRWDAQATAVALSKEFVGFDVHTTKHYVIIHNASEAYVRWCGGLLERLLDAFQGYWRGKGLTLQQPEHPLVVIIFGDQAEYAKHAVAELGEGAEGIVGYYNLKTNRVTLYDLTGLQAGRAGTRGSRGEITQMLRQKESLLNVATIIHEATHQVAYNSGMHQRLADVPLWVAEGIAVYFETPDLSSARGWRKVDQVNPLRLKEFKDYSRARPADSLKTLIANDARFRDQQAARSAYAEAWALNYFLLKTQPKQYVRYLQHLSTKPQLVWDTEAARVEEFETLMELDLPRLDTQLLRYYR